MTSQTREIILNFYLHANGLGNWVCVFKTHITNKSEITRSNNAKPHVIKKRCRNNVSTNYDIFIIKILYIFLY